MRITYVVPALKQKGGIQEFALTIYGRLMNRHSVELVDWSDSVGAVRKGIMKALPESKAAEMYWKISKKDFPAADIIHFWHPEPSIGAEGRYVVSAHGMEIMPESVKGYRRHAYSRSFEASVFVHANSTFTARTLMEGFDVDKWKIRTINPPLTVGISRMRRKNEVPVIGTLSRLVKRKNIPTIIDALDILHDRKEPFRYVLAGDGPMQDEITKCLKKAGFEWEYMGEISEKKKRNSFYPGIDVFVLPTLQLPDDVEGFGMVYLEANAYGVPVVAARNGGVPDAVKEGVSGRFARPDDPVNIADVILKVLRERDRYEESARAWAERFLPSKMVPEFEKMYSDAL